jgi:MFS transporter, SP family, solute carrier family 2 (myo-inositol transporter), member 13
VYLLSFLLQVSVFPDDRSGKYIDDTGVISAMLVSIGDALSGRQLTTGDKSLITASTSFFALLASPVAGWTADQLGRRNVLLVADGLFIAGAVWQAFAQTVPSMIAGRSVVGVAVGAASLIVPLYISELAPAAYRGRLVVIQILMITLGQVVAYGVGWGFSVQEGGWRWMVGLGAVPAGVQGVMLVAWLPESPRWLVKVGKGAEARRVLWGVFEGGDGVEGVVRGIELEIAGEESEKGGWWELWSERGNRKALFMACFLQGLQQLCGFVCPASPLLKPTH